MKLGKWILALPLIGVLAVLGACGRQQATGPEMQLRTYSVPVAHQEQLQAALSTALIIKKGNEHTTADVFGRVALIDKGQLLVSAPPRIQDDIAKFLAEFKPSQQPAPERQTAVDVWVVIADDARGASGSDPQLDEISEPLEAIRKAQNVQGFTLVERLSVNSERGRQFVKGARASLEMGSDNIADIKYGPGITTLGLKANPPGFRPAELHTALKLQPGKAIVLGQSGLARDADTGQAVPASIFYVLRARALD